MLTYMLKAKQKYWRKSMVVSSRPSTYVSRMAVTIFNYQASSSVPSMLLHHALAKWIIANPSGL